MKISILDDQRIERGASVEALGAGGPGMVAVDACEQQPVRDAGHPLLAMDNAVCTPHIGYLARDEHGIQFGEIIDQILAHQAGTPINVINPDVPKP